MEITNKVENILSANAYLIPFTKESGLNVTINEQLDTAINIALGEFKGTNGDTYTLNLPVDDKLVTVVLLGVGDVISQTNRELYLSFLKGLKLCKKAETVAVMLENVPLLLENSELCRKVFILPYQISYDFQCYKSEPKASKWVKTIFATGDKDFAAEMTEADIYGYASAVTRNLINHPSMTLTPTKLSEEVEKECKELEVSCRTYGVEEIRELKMGAFLSVSKGASEEPKLIVMNYNGGSEDDKKIGLIGKGITYDSGGYSLKGSMATMFNDMGGAGVVAGVMVAIAKAKLPINVVAVIPACENKIGPDAYVPGDILFSMSGKTIEMVNSDAEGRLILADAITYAIRQENADVIIDLATLTGAAKGAVGNKTAPVVTNSDELWDALWSASKSSCEKVWRLDKDMELRPALNSSVADIKNSNPGGNCGGGTILGGLFLHEFIEAKPWIHIDIAPVTFRAEESDLARGATGFGVDLVYTMLKNM